MTPHANAQRAESLVNLAIAIRDKATSVLDEEANNPDEATWLANYLLADANTLIRAAQVYATLATRNQ